MANVNELPPPVEPAHITDSLHISEQGHKVISERIMEAVQTAHLMGMPDDMQITKLDLFAGFALLGIMIHNSNPANQDTRSGGPTMKSECELAAQYAIQLATETDDLLTNMDEDDD